MTAMIADKLAHLHGRIASACKLAGRPVESVTLLSVSKTFGPEAVREAEASGERRFGENYVLEAVEKITALADLRDRIEWHLIGPLQSNKTRVVAEQFDWVHTIDRLKTAQRLSTQRPADRPPLQLCLQVNIDAEPGKSGLRPDEVIELARAVAVLPRLTLRGLMSIPAPTSDVAAQRESHRALHDLLDALNDDGLALDTLSMGMSADLEAAIAEGATVVRVGSAIFGDRGPLR